MEGLLNNAFFYSRIYLFFLDFRSFLLISKMRDVQISFDERWCT